ncbi:MAG: hypothetical protein Kow00124_32640 [Anaerolineae bacterium]
MSVRIQQVITPQDKRAFYAFAWRVYRDDPNWVPHLWPQRKAYLDRKAAFFTYGEGEFWLARRGSEVVGTIGTAIDHSRNRHRGERAAVFGFFEVLPDDYEAAAALWDHACGWSRAHGMALLHGPFNFSGSDDPGFLVEGFDCPPTVLMGHTPPYYAAFAERYGFTKRADSLAYRTELSHYGYDVANLPPTLLRIAERARARHGADLIRSPRLENWDAEIRRLHPLYNKSLLVLPEFAPIELAEFEEQALALKPVMDPDLIFIAELKGRAVGFALGLPNINEALLHAGGLRYPWDYARLALARRRIHGASFKILAVDPDYWGYGIEAVMFVEMYRALAAKGYTWADGSLTAEDNPQTNKLATRLGAHVYRRYREYGLAL